MGRRDRSRPRTLPYAGHSATAPDIPETQGPHLDHTTVGSGRASEAVEVIDQTTPTDPGLLPISVVLLQGLQKHGEIPVASGPTTDIWRGTLNNKPAAFKTFRIHPWDLQEAKKVLLELAPIWKRPIHENVLPFHGIDQSIFRLALVYDWGHNGNIIQYLESHPNASRAKLVAKGLQYLHSLEIFHGDLKGANVVISKSGRAQVCDYGLIPIISNPIFTIATTPGVAGSSRWLAPEIIDLPKPSSEPTLTSKCADIFAFAMLAVEVFSGGVPFEGTKDESVVIQIASGKRPAKPRDAEQLGLSAEMWKFIEQCWSASPNKRPIIDEVVRIWEGFVNGHSSGTLVSKASGRQSQFAEPSDIYAEKHEPPPRKTRLCCVL